MAQQLQLPLLNWHPLAGQLIHLIELLLLLPTHAHLFVVYELQELPQFQPRQLLQFCQLCVDNLYDFVAHQHAQQVRHHRHGCHVLQHLLLLTHLSLQT
jgi:hypothetical protein